MKLTRLTVENFMPFKGRQFIEFPQDESRNVMLVYGENMRGKTSFLNAIRWALYGSAVGRHSREIPLHLVANTEAMAEGDRALEVVLEFQHQDSAFTLRRRAELRNVVSRPNRPEDFVITVLLSRNGAPVPSDLLEQTIAEIVPEQVSRFFLFDGELLQEYETLLIESNKQGQEIKDSIEQVLGVPSLTQARDDLQTILRAARKEQQKDLSQIQGLQSILQRQREMSEKEDQLNDDLEKLVVQLTDTKARIKELESDLTDHEARFSQGIKLERYRFQKQQEEEKLTQLADERRGLMANAWIDLLATKTDAARKVLLDEQQTITKQIKAQAKIEVEADNITTLLQHNHCPVCSQEIGENRTRDFLIRLDVLKTDLINERDLRARHEAITVRLVQLQSVKSTRAYTKLLSIRSSIEKHTFETVSLESRIAELEQELQGFDTESMKNERYKQQSLAKEEGRLNGEIAKLRTEIDKVQTDLKLLQARITPNAEGRSKLSTKRVETLERLDAIFRDSIDVLRDKLKTSVESKASEAFRSLTTQSSYKGLRINDSYGLQIVDKSDKVIAVRSAGAEQIVALSLIDGLNRTGRGIGPIIMDTPFGRLDLNHRERILRYLPQTANQLVILVHSGEMQIASEMASMSDRIGIRYEIQEINHHHSEIRRVTQ